MDSGIVVEEFFEIRTSLGYPGLLKNDFRKPNDIWFLGISPWQLPLVMGIPTEQYICKMLGIQNNWNFSDLVILQQKEANFVHLVFILDG
jgi:hypothetical protein